MKAAIGQEFRSIRRKRRIRVTAIYSDIVARSTFNRFENDQNTIGTSKFFSIIYRIGLSYSEMVVRLLARRLETPVTQVFQKLEDEDLSLHQLERAAEITQLPYFKNRLALARVYWDYQKNGEITTSQLDLNALTTYLNEIDSLNSQSMMVMYHLIPCLSWDAIDHLLPLVLKNSEDEIVYLDDFQRTFTRGQILMQIVSRALATQDEKQFRLSYLLYSQVKVSTDDIETFVAKQFYDLLIDNLQTGDDSSLVKAKHLTIALEHIKMPRLSERLKQDLSNFRGMIQ